MAKSTLMKIAVISGAVAVGLVGAMMNGWVGLFWGVLLGGTLAGAITSSFIHNA